LLWSTRGLSGPSQAATIARLGCFSASLPTAEVRDLAHAGECERITRAETASLTVAADDQAVERLGIPLLAEGRERALRRTQAAGPTRPGNRPQRAGGPPDPDGLCDHRRGGRALGAWLATQPGPPRFEFETMLRLVYADQGTKEEFLGAVQAARSWAKAPIYGWARAGPGLPATSSSTCSRPWPLGPSVILATGCAGQHGGADIKHAPAPATTDARPPGNHEGHGRSRGGRTSDPSR
jgi:hypothetical protein